MTCNEPSHITTVCARCGKHDSAPAYDPDVEMEVCPTCDDYLRNYTDGPRNR